MRFREYFVCKIDSGLHEGILGVPELHKGTVGFHNCTKGLWILELHKGVQECVNGACGSILFNEDVGSRRWTVGVKGW